MINRLAMAVALLVLAAVAADVAAPAVATAAPYVYQKCRDTPWLCQKVRLHSAF